MTLRRLLGPKLTQTGHNWPELSNSLSISVSVGWKPSGVGALAGAWEALCCWSPQLPITAYICLMDQNPGAA